MDAQTLLIPFLNIGCNARLRRTVAQGDTLPTRHFDDAINLGNPVFERLNHCMSTGALGQYNEVPDLAAIMDIGDSKTAHPATDKKPAVAGGPAAKKAKINDNGKSKEEG
eukprot:scaffold7801_cov115-Cylindrotheca_fusiformis.AAC.1